MEPAIHCNNQKKFKQNNVVTLTWLIYEKPVEWSTTCKQAYAMVPAFPEESPADQVVEK